MLMTAAGSATCFWLPRRQPEQCKTERGSGENRISCDVKSGIGRRRKGRKFKYLFISFSEPPIAPEFQTRRLARVLYRSESSNRRREVAFHPNSNRLRVRYAYFLRRHLPLSFRFSMASSARKRPRCEVPATPGRVPCPCNTCIPDACFPPELIKFTA